MNQIIHLSDCVISSFIHDFCEIILGLIIILIEIESIFNPFNVFLTGQFRNTQNNRIHQSVNYEITIFTQNLQSLVAVWHKIIFLITLLLRHHLFKVCGIEEFTVLPLDAELRLEIAEEVAKINMKKTAVVDSQHHVRRVPVCDPHDPGQDALAGTTFGEVRDYTVLLLVFFDSVFFTWLVIFRWELKVIQLRFFEWVHSTVWTQYCWEIFGIDNNFYETFFLTRCFNFVSI